MGTTTIRLEEDLQARIAAAAEREGKTAHAFIVDAIVRTVERSESDDALQRKAEQLRTDSQRPAMTRGRVRPDQESIRSSSIHASSSV